MRKVYIKPQARFDLLEIWTYIAQDSLSAAHRVSEKIDAAIAGLAHLPGKGHLRPDVKDSQFRFWTVYSYVIAYRYDESSLTVVRVVHGKRNLRKMFRQSR